MEVDIWSDVVCPWCYLGSRRFRAGAAEAGVDVQVRWRPFRLDPRVPPGGGDHLAAMVAKFGDEGRVRRGYEQLTRLGAAEGVDFRFERITRRFDTTDAHRLLWLAGERGHQDAVAEALFAAYFTEGHDLSDPDRLVEAAASAGLDGEATRAALAAGEGAEEVAEDLALAAELGITAVPTFVLDGRLAVPGAQEPATFARLLERLAARPGGGSGGTGGSAAPPGGG